MWIVRLALRRPYTFVVMAMLVAILGIVTILNTPKDIFPDIDIPVIATSGLDPEDQVVTNPGERLSDGIKVRILNSATRSSR